jgi:DNA-binding response OmpR family regulator
MATSSDLFQAKILIVDDKDVNIILLERSLRAAGYASVFSTTRSGEVCELHRRNGYELILLDLEMPGTDGFKVMEGLKDLDVGGALDVLAVSAHPDYKTRALASGAKDFIGKPFDLSEVAIRIRALLNARRRPDPSAGQSVWRIDGDRLMREK